MDAVVAHSEHGATRLRNEAGLDPGKVRVIPHGAFDYLTRLPEEKPLPPELEGAQGPVILSFGLLRPYKGIENLLEAFGQLAARHADAELWIVGNPRMDVEPLRRQASEVGGRVRTVTRFVDDAEIPAIFRRADLVVLPYLDAEHSGVLYTGLAFGKPLVLSAVGGFPEVGETGAAQLVPPGDTAALAATLAELIGDEAARAELAAAATRAAAGPYSWDEAARRTMDLYRELIEARP
jgi:glycosyltransferase involved in cell wall biosynthesis